VVVLNGLIKGDHRIKERGNSMKIIKIVALFLWGAYCGSPVTAAQPKPEDDFVLLDDEGSTVSEEAGIEGVRTLEMHIGKRIREVSGLAGHRELYCAVYGSEDAGKLFDEQCVPAQLNGDVIVHGAFIGSKLVGSLLVLKKQRCFAEILLLGAAPLRRAGIASFLLSSFAQKALEHYEITMLNAFVPQGNIPARRFLETMGFANIGYDLAREEADLKDMKKPCEQGAPFGFTDPVRIALRERRVSKMRQSELYYASQLDLGTLSREVQKELKPFVHKYGPAVGYQEKIEELRAANRPGRGSVK
jgi:GNAT superfamily N-acetyltransferase